MSPVPQLMAPSNSTLALRLFCRRHDLVRLPLHISRIDDVSHARHPPVASDRSLRKLQTSTCRGKTTLVIHDILVPQSTITACGSSLDTYFSISYRESWGSKLPPRREAEKELLFRPRQNATCGTIAEYDECSNECYVDTRSNTAFSLIPKHFLELRIDILELLKYFLVCLVSAQNGPEILYTRH
jgi:hypothetical protein